jgi:hypothetical protein
MRRITSEVYTDGTSHSVHSCSRHGPATARLTSERPGNVIPVPKMVTLLTVRCRSRCDAASLYVLALLCFVVSYNFLIINFSANFKSNRNFLRVTELSL